MQGFRKLTCSGSTRLWLAVVLVNLFTALGYGLALLFRTSIADPTPKLWLLLGLGLIVGWSNGASP